MEEARTFLAGPPFPVRFVTLSYGDGAGLLSASYWYEAAGQTTDDFAVRIWDDLAPHRDRWVLVTVLFDRMHDPQSIEIQTLYTALHDTVQLKLKGGVLE